MALKPRKSLRDRLILQFLLLTSVTIVTLAVISVVVAGAHIRQRIYLQLASETSAREDVIEQRLRQDWEYISLWSKQNDVRNTNALNTVFVSAQEEGIPLLGVGIFTLDGALMNSIGSLPIEQLHLRIGGGIPIVNDEGWVGHLVVVPVKNTQGDVQYFSVGHFDMRGTLQAVLATAGVGETAELLLGKEEDGNLVLLHHQYTAGAYNISIGPFQQYIAKGDPLAKALLQQEGVIRTKNYEGRDVFAAYKYLPRLGWGMTLTIDASEALLGIWAIGFATIAVSLLLFGMAIFLAISFATRLTAPLRNMATAVAELGPKNWFYKATADTEDELQLVDETVADMASRLKGFYSNLEKQVTDRTQELREQYEIDKAILQSTVHGILLVSPEGTVRSMNPAAEALLCQDGSMCQNMPVHQMFRLFRKNHEVSSTKHPIMDCLSTGTPIVPQADVLWTLQNAAGDYIAIDLTATLVHNNNKVIGAVAVFRDVSGERHVDEVKSEFISLASHQLRTPLSVIKWYSELLEDDKYKNDQDMYRGYVSEIQSSAERMSNLVDALLQAAQLESKGIMAEKVDVNMNKFVADLEQDLENLARDKHIDCKITLPKQPIELSTDPVLLHIVIQNLFSNAVKYTPDNGSVSIILKHNKEAATIEVTDTGIGIPSKDRTRIFERLFRAENAKKSVTDGSGLGLYISHMILDILGGSIDFKSKEGKGTTFVVELPIQ